MPTLSKINDILCSNISKIDDILKANARKIDDIDFCTPTATPTPTVTIGGTPTPTPSVTFTQTPTVTRTPAVTPTPSVTITQTPTVTRTQTPAVTQTPTVTRTQTPTKTVTPTPTPSPAVNCVDGETTNGGFYSFYDCCGVYFEGSGEPPFVACYDANKLNTGISFGDPCSYSCVTPTPTITPTPTETPTNTPTPTATPCTPDCCYVELCYDCCDPNTACMCNDVRSVYLSICQGAACRLSLASGVYKDSNCSNPSDEGYYSDGNDVYLWTPSVPRLDYVGPC